MRSPHTHPPRRACVALLTALTLLAPTVRAAEPAAATPAETALFDKARKLYGADEYLPAAEAFEALHGDTKNPLYLYYAGLAREGAGHDAHAIRHWQQALHLGLDPEFTTKAKTRLDQARTRTTAVTVTVTPAGVADGATLELRSSARQREPLTFALTDLPAHLEPGKWTATLTPKHRGFKPLELPLTIVRGAPELAQDFELRPIEHPTTFEFTPADASLDGVVLTLQDAENLAPERRLPVKTTNRLKISLRAGTWNYILEAPGRPAQSGTLNVTADTEPVTIDLTTGRTAPNNDNPPGDRSTALLAKPTRRKLALGLGLGALAPAIAGGVLTGLAASSQPEPMVKNGINIYSEPDLIKSNNYFGFGPLLLGSAGGLWIGTILSGLPVRRRAWYGVLGAGAIIGAGGLAWNIASFQRRNSDFSDKNDIDIAQNDWRGYKGHLAASTAVLGLGAGLFLSSVIALITARAGKRNRAARARYNGDIFRPGFTIRF